MAGVDEGATNGAVVVVGVKDGADGAVDDVGVIVSVAAGVVKGVDVVPVDVDDVTVDTGVEDWTGAVPNGLVIRACRSRCICLRGPVGAPFIGTVAIFKWYTRSEKLDQN